LVFLQPPFHRPGQPDQAQTKQVLIPWISSRLALFLLAWVGLLWRAPVDKPEHWRKFADMPMLDGWARWDSAWYASIALDGYQWLPGQACNVNFFPLYAWTTWAVSLPLRIFLSDEKAFYVAGMAWSLALFYVALVGLQRLGQREWGEALTGRVLMLLAWFPFSLFFSAVYTESLFLALCVWAFVYAREDRWWRAAALVALAGVTRVTGAVLGLALAIEFAQVARLDWQKWKRDGIAFVISPLPVLSLFLYFKLQFGEALLFLKTYTTVWDKRPGLSRLIDVLNSIRHDRDPLALRFQNLMYVLVLFGALALVIWARKRLSWGMQALVLVSVVLVASTGFNAAGRYTAVLFPAFAALAMLLNDRGYKATLALSALTCLWFTWDFSHWMHVT
jgi:Gpi18-like mannosyltransferase